jgi:hypothetical protein
MTQCSKFLIASEKVRKFTLRLAAASVIALVPAGASLADPPNTLVDAPYHRHFIVTPNGDLVRIGPDICADPDLQQAFNEFHFNIHDSALPGIGAIDTLGPQDGAPGLHDGLGADMTAIRGCG